MQHIKQQLEKIQTVLQRALSEVRLGGRMEQASEERKCIRLWACLSGVQGMLGDIEPVVLQGSELLWKLFTGSLSTCEKFQRQYNAGVCEYDSWLVIFRRKTEELYTELQAELRELNDRVEVAESNAPAEMELSGEDEWAIRRAVWSRALASNLEDCKCPYPVGHAHRAIWVDEIAILAKEHHERILEQTPPPAPQPEPLDMGEALRIFGRLPMGCTYEGEVIELRDFDQSNRLPAVAAH